MNIPSTLVTAALIVFSACHPRSYNSSNNETLSSNQKTKITFPDFCSAPNTEGPLWGANLVQREITKLIEENDFKASGLSTYAEAYLAMTAARDKSRCSPQDPMFPKSALARRLNDTLADLMTKGFVASQRSCFRLVSGNRESIPEIGKQLCQISQKAVIEHWSALEYAMASSAIYLTSLMGIAVSALPHVDSLWEETAHRSLDDRLRAMIEFRETYDAFNMFLSNNLHTVARVLVREKRVNCKIFELAARSAEITRAPSLLFKDIRSRTFELGLKLARQWPKGLHPLTAGGDYWDAQKDFGVFASEPEALAELRLHGQKTISILRNPLLKVFNGENIATFVTFEGLTCPTKK